MDFSNLWKYCFRFTRAAFRTRYNYMAYRYQQSLSRYITCQDACV